MFQFSFLSIFLKFQFQNMLYITDVYKNKILIADKMSEKSRKNL